MGIYFSNMSRVLENVKEELFWDHVHINNHGNELVAREMAVRLLPMVGQSPACLVSATTATASTVIVP